LAAEFYYQRQMLFDVAKHLYDLTLLMNKKRIATLVTKHNELLRMLEYKRREEQYRVGSDLAQKPFADFLLSRHLKPTTSFRRLLPQCKGFTFLPLPIKSRLRK
jgi:hypothetical protein